MTSLFNINCIICKEQITKKFTKFYDSVVLEFEILYKNYIEGLDPSKRLFMQSDIDEFSK
jgi:hypothetical protein